MRERREPLFQGRPAPGLAYPCRQNALSGSTSEPQAGQRKMPSGRRRIWGWPHSSQAWRPKVLGRLVILRRSPKISPFRVQPHRLQWAAEGSINFIRPSSQCGQTMRPGREAGAAGALQHLPDDGHLQSRAPGHARCRRERHGRCPILGISHVSRRGPQGPASAARDDRPSLAALIERPFPNEED
jgi:hypothetical protein